MVLSIDQLAKGPTGHLFYGYGGSGKTTICRAAAELFGWERTLWLNTDRAIQGFDYPRFDENQYGVVDLVSSGEDSNTACEQVAKAIRPAYDAARKGQWMYDLIVYDGYSETERRNFDQRDSQIQSRDQRQIWGVQAHDIQQIMWMLQSGSRESRKKGVRIDYPPLGAVVVATAQVRERDVAEETRDPKNPPPMELAPGIRGQQGDRVDHYYNQVLYLRRVESHRNLYLIPRGRIHVKNDWEHVLPAGKVFMEVPRLSKANAFEQILREHKLISTTEER